MSNNVVSVRLPFEYHEKMLLDCARQKINPTEWMLQKIAIANQKDDAKKNIVRMLTHLRRRTRFENSELYNSVIELSNYVEEHL
jgi:hypothetical protein